MATASYAISAAKRRLVSLSPSSDYFATNIFDREKALGRCGIIERTIRICGDRLFRLSRDGFFFLGVSASNLINIGKLAEIACNCRAESTWHDEIDLILCVFLLLLLQVSETTPRTDVIKCCPIGVARDVAND